MGVILGGGSGEGRFLRQWAVAIVGLAGLGLAALLIIIPRYHLQQQAIAMAREQAMRGNMRVLQMALEQYMAEDGRGYPASLVRTDPRRDDPMIDFLSQSLKRLRNPFDKDEPPVALSRRDPPFWKSYKRGQIIYVPLGVREGHADGYVIYGLGAKGPISTVVDRRPEPRRPSPEEGEADRSD